MAANDGTTPASVNPTTLAIPMKLDAFVLNEKACSGNLKQAKIAPIVQPNYTFLRLDDFYIQSDVLNHTDLHFTTPAACNSRITDLGTGQLREHRKGVYLHWMLPKPYRQGTRIQQNPSDANPVGSSATAVPTDDASKIIPDLEAPQFPEVPTRWLVVRKIENLEACEPKNHPIPQVQSWIIESDLKRNLDNLPDDTDMQVDVSPFISATKTDTDTLAVESQAEVFIGSKIPAEGWRDQGQDLDRADVSLMNSSNPLFPDYQPHNSNVFSMLDNFEYNEGGQRKYLTKASASYYVVGWHPSYSTGLLTEIQDDKMSRRARIEALGMSYQLAGEQFKTWLDATGGVETICHGAMYNVVWSQWKSEEETPKIAANIYAERLIADLPISIGTTPMDALMTYVHAHHNPETKAVPDLEDLLLRIEILLRSRDDGVEAQRQAADNLTHSNFRRESGGSRFFLSGENPATSNSTPAKLTVEEMAALKQLNQLQVLEDANARSAAALQWEMFSSWWQFMSDLEANDKQSTFVDTNAGLAKRLKALRDQVAVLGETRTSVPANIRDAAKKAAQPHFIQARDPTLLVGGIEPGWPTDYLDKLPSRFDLQIIQGASPVSETTGSFASIFQNVLPALPEKVRKCAAKLIHEFVALHPDVNTAAIPDVSVNPHYHDDKFQPLDSKGPPDSEGKPGSLKQLWRDRWENRQPWFPLFLEWEVEYCHIPFENWTLEERTSRQSTAAKLRLGIKPDYVVQDNSIEGKRTISGRVLILPQPNFSLKAKIDSLFDGTPKTILDKYMSSNERTLLKAEIHKLGFLSAPIAGFSDHLITRAHGTHIKPTFRAPGEILRPLKAAIRDNVGFTREWLDQVQTHTDVTPYGTSVTTDPTSSAFKPAAHGQFRFTKLNIIDKFGQAIHAIDPTPFKRGPPSIYPCISEYYEPQSVKGQPLVANTIKQAEKGKCEYIQVPPSINQLARLNSAFMKLESSDETNQSPHWRPVTEWENPIWGWLMINYANQGVQVFLHDGTFYREVRFGGPKGTQQSPPWLPFSPPKTDKDTPAVESSVHRSSDTNPDNKDKRTYQLQKLCDKLKNPRYLQAVVNMMTQSLKNSPSPPGAYAEFLNSVVGRPVALVNMGWSLELSVNPYRNTSTLNTQRPSNTLLEPGQDQTQYEFQIKIGDGEREYDGLLGYFNPPQPWPSAPTEDSMFDLDDIYTFFNKDSTSTADAPSRPTVSRRSGPPPSRLSEEQRTKLDPRVLIDETNYPWFKAFYIDPLSVNPLPPDPRASAATPPPVAPELSYEKLRNQQYHVFGAILDPFTPVHGYSSVLPVTSLKLPPWSWQEALQRMTAFFKLGPLLLTSDVPVYNSEHVLASNYNLANKDVVPGSKVGIPAGDMQDWAWLQPYIDQEEKKKGDLLDGRRYMPLGLAKTDHRPRFEDGPYTMVEGYLQMRRPVVRDLAGSST